MKRISILLCLFLVVLLPSCTTGKGRLPKHVVIIGIDGWASTYFADDDIPFIKSLREQASWTIDKRCVVPTASAINWMTIFTGVPPEYHGYMYWYSRRPVITPAWTDQRGEVPTVFRLERDQHPESKMLVTYQWDVIRSLVDSVAVNDVVGFEQSAPGDSIEVEFAAQYFKENKPDLSLVYFGNLDHIGHEYGWASQEYKDYLSHMDGMVERIVEAVREAGMEEETVFLLTSDHGGFDHSHSKFCDKDEVLRTPLFIWGKGIKKGYEISRPTIQTDLTATLAYLLHLQTPQHWTGKIIDEIFE